MIQGLSCLVAFLFQYQKHEANVLLCNAVKMLKEGEGEGKGRNACRQTPNLVPRAFPLKNGWGGKRPWHRLVTCSLVHPKILGVIN